MAHLIDKSALVAEIYKWKNHVLNCGYHGQGEYEDGNKQGKLDACDKFVSFINSLEVKEVDLDKETTHYLLYEHRSPLNEIMHKADLKSEMQYHKDIENAFKAGFELGMQTQYNKELVEEVYSHIDSIKDTADRMTSGNFMHHKASIKFSANTIAKVLELIGLKAQGEKV